MNKLPDYVAKNGRHGHDLTHDFSFTSSTGHLLTVFSEIMYPKDTIKGRCAMFTRTNPLLQPANVEIDEYIDYFFVPLDMIMSGFGDFLYQVNEPYSSITHDILSSMFNGEIPVCKFSTLFGSFSPNLISGAQGAHELSVYFDNMDDLMFLSVYRNMFHNGLNPNSLFAAAYVSDYTLQERLAYPADMFQPNVLPLSLCAYNCVYENFYRIDEWEKFDPRLYNIDRDLSLGQDLFTDVPEEFFKIKYRPLHFDYFTSGNPTPMFNSLNTIDASKDLLRINDYLSASGIFLGKRDNSLSPSPDDASQIKSLLTNYSGQVSTQQIRSMFAVEKILSITQRAKKTYDAQVLAHMGVHVPHDVKHEIIKVGTQHSQIKIGEVVSTAGTSDTPLGDIAGKGYSVMPDSDIKFTAPCHGVFIGIYSAVPRIRYYAPLEKRLQITNRLDFWCEEFEKLGTQPIYNWEAFAALNFDGTPHIDVVSWQMRYEQYKRRFNKVSPAFVDTILRGNDATESYGDQTLQSFNSWHNWTVVRRPYNGVSDNVSVSLSDLLASPTLLNGLMAVDYGTKDYWNDLKHSNPDFFKLDDEIDDTPSARNSFVWNLAELFYRDPLLHFCTCNFKVVNQMSDNTLPDLIG